MNLITNNVVNNLSNSKELKDNFKAEYYLFRDIMFSVSRCVGYLILLLVCLIFGMEYINYILIISAISILFEGVIVNKIAKQCL